MRLPFPSGFAFMGKPAFFYLVNSNRSELRTTITVDPS